MHIYATNHEVGTYNNVTLTATCPDAITIEAQDFERNPKTGRMERKCCPHKKVFNSCLSERGSLAVNARVILQKNIDVSDGLVNGAFGTVVHITASSDDSFPSAIHVLFDDPKVGQKHRSKMPSVTSTMIEPQEDQVTNSGGMRRQFPLKLAWACTIHKVQGLS